MALKLYFHPLASFCHKALIALHEKRIPFEPIIVEFLDAHYPGPTRFLPADVDRAWQTRMWDRFYDHYVQEPMQKIVADRLRPEGKADAYGVELAKAHRGHGVRGTWARDGEMETPQASGSKAWPTYQCRRRPSTNW